ncbi:CoA pyrophosphatase [Rhodovibrionaceae bacterium A322]
MIISDIKHLLAQHQPGARGAPGPEGHPGQIQRGDHDLNPDTFRPTRRLTGAAVLVPLVQRPEGLTVLLTRRTDHLHDHAGQVAFPGGRIDPEDENAIAAALRETEEEVGLARRHIEIIGRLDTYITRTGFDVTPVVGSVTPPFDLELDAFEVAEAFEVPLSLFLDTSNREIQTWVIDDVERYFYVYPYQDYFIWGATAGMLNNLAEILTVETVS